MNTNVLLAHCGTFNPSKVDKWVSTACLLREIMYYLCCRVLVYIVDCQYSHYWGLCTNISNSINSITV